MILAPASGVLRTRMFQAPSRSVNVADRDVDILIRVVGLGIGLGPGLDLGGQAAQLGQGALLGPGQQPVLGAGVSRRRLGCHRGLLGGELPLAGRARQGGQLLQALGRGQGLGRGRHRGAGGAGQVVGGGAVPSALPGPGVVHPGGGCGLEVGRHRLDGGGLGHGQGGVGPGEEGGVEARGVGLQRLPQLRQPLAHATNCTKGV